jgi:multiple sugar transport system ATP-binding protein
MRTEISKLYQNLGTTFIYVTHDQTEAMTLGTRIVVMKDGVIQQVDTPQNLYDKPQNLFVAGFMGSPQMNFIDSVVTVSGTSVYLVFGNNKILVPEARAKKLIEGGYAPETPAAIVYKATWPEEKIYRCTVGTLGQTVRDNALTKTSLIVVGGFLGNSYDRSKLYDPGFTTEFRQAEK